MRTVRPLAAVPIVLILSSFLAAPGYGDFEGYWLQTSVSESEMPMAGKRSETKEEKIFYKAGMMKMVDLGTGEMTILRMDKELMWRVNVEESTYTEFTFAEMEKMAAEGKKKMAQVRAEMEKEMIGMPPEQRKLMEKMMGGKMSALMGDEEARVELSLKRTGEKEKVGGYPCERVIVTANDVSLVEMWVTDRFDLGGELFTLYEKMNLFKFEPSDGLKQFKGFPMKIVFTMDAGLRTVKNVTTVSKVVKTSLKESDFDLPEGLKRKEMKMIRPK